MALFLDRIDSAPIIYSDFDAQFLQWLWVLVDSINENLTDLEGVVLSQTAIAGTSVTVDGNSLYVPENTALTSFQLPAVIQAGSRVTIAGFGAGGWTLLTGAGQNIQLPETNDTAVTSVSSASRYDTIEIICVQDNKTWTTLSSQTTGFTVV